MSVELLPGAALAPDVLLHQVLDSLEGIKGVVVLKVNEHGAVEVCTSRITIHELAFATLNLQLYTAEVVNGRPPEGTDVIIPPRRGCDE